MPLTLTQLKYNIPCLLKFSNVTRPTPTIRKRLISYDTVIEDREKQNKIDVPGYGACEGTLACSTCILHFSQEDYDRLCLSEIDEEEQDLLDKGVDVIDTFRLGCSLS